MSAIFNLNNFSKFAQNQPDAADSFDQSEIDLINKKSSSLITKDEVDKIYNYVKRTVGSNPKDPYINKIFTLLNTLSGERKVSIPIRSLAKRYLMELDPIVRRSLVAENIIQQNISVPDSGRISGRDLMSSLVETINSISKQIVAKKLRDLTPHNKDISKIVNEAKASLPKNGIWGHGLKERLSAVVAGGDFSEKAEYAIAKKLENPIFDLYDFYGVHVPRFLYLYLNADRSILNKLSENQDVHNQLNGIFQSYSGYDMSDITNSYDTNRNSGLPIHASVVEWQEGDGVKKSFFLIEILKHFINVLKNPKNYGKAGESAEWLVVDKFFNNITREMSFQIATEDKGAGSTRADLPRAYEVERTTIEGMEHYAVTNNFFNSLNSKISEFKNTGVIKFLNAIVDYSGNTSLDGWATKVVNEINNAIFKFENNCRSAAAYNSDVLGLLYGDVVENFNFIIQRMNYGTYASNKERYETAGSFTSSVITDGVEVKFRLRAVPASYKIKINPNDYWKEEISKSFSKELVVDDISVQILDVPVFEASGTKKDQTFYSYQAVSSQVDIFDKVPLEKNEKSATYSYSFIEGSNGEENRQVFGVPMYSFKNIENFKLFLDGKDDNEKSVLLNEARDQISYFLSSNLEVLKIIASKYLRSKIPIQVIEKTNPSHVTRFFQLLEDISNNYISKLSIVAGGSGLSDEAFECYGSLGRIVLESNIRNLNDKIENAKKSNLNLDDLTKELSDAKDLKKRLDDIFHDFHTPEGTKQPREIIRTEWMSGRSGFPEWLLRNLIRDKKQYNESLVSSGSSGVSGSSYEAKRYEDIRNFIKQILMTWNPYELIDLIYVYKIKLGPIQEMQEKKKELGLAPDESLSDLAPKMCGKLLAKFELEGHLGPDDVKKIGNIFRSTDDGGCEGNKCTAFREAYQRSGGKVKIKKASKTSAAQIEKISSCCDLSKNKIIGYNINDWLRMIARRAYIG